MGGASYLFQLNSKPANFRDYLTDRDLLLECWNLETLIWFLNFAVSLLHKICVYSCMNVIQYKT